MFKYWHWLPLVQLLLKPPETHSSSKTNKSMMADSPEHIFENLKTFFQLQQQSFNDNTISKPNNRHIVDINNAFIKNTNRKIYCLQNNIASCFSRYVIIKPKLKNKFRLQNDTFFDFMKLVPTSHTEIHFPAI